MYYKNIIKTMVLAFDGLIMKGWTVKKVKNNHIGININSIRHFLWSKKAKAGRILFGGRINIPKNNPKYIMNLCINFFIILFLK